MRILLLGAGGFIGCHLTARLVKDGVHDLTAIDIIPDKLADVLNSPKLRYLNYDIRTKTEEIEEEVRTHDLIVDLIAFANPSLYVSNPVDVS